MEPVTLALGGTTMTLLGVVGKIVYNYGRDRKELNGTVERVKSIQEKLDKHIRDEEQELIGIRHGITELQTKMDLLINHKIRDK